jgi:hypothetical protein
MAERKLTVFLCHASQDKPAVRELYQKLLAEGWIEPWLDEEQLVPEQDWDFEIERAVESTNAVIVCVSSSSTTKEGYIQRELKFVLDIALEKPEGEIYIIPVRLDDCQIPRRLKAWHYVDYFIDTNVAYEKILKSLRSRSKSISLSITKESDYKEPAKSDSKESNLHYSSNDIRIGMWAPSSAGKTTYLLSLYISALQGNSEWLIAFDENTNSVRRQYLFDSINSLRHGAFPAPTKVGADLDLFGLVFYPSPQKSKYKLKNIGTDELISFWNNIPIEHSPDKAKKGLQISLGDVGGESYLSEPIDGPLWQHLAGCQGILCLLDPSEIENNLHVFSNLTDFLFAKVKKDKPNAIINNRYLPHYVSICFTKMDKPEWRSMINNPDEVIGKISDLINLDIRRLLWIHFMPERINFHCVSSIGFDFAENKHLQPINIFSPLGDWLET